MVLGMRMTHRQHRGSVLPQLTVVRSGGGARLSTRPRWQDLALVLTLLAFVILLVAIAMLAPAGRSGRAIGGIFGIGGPLVAYGGHYLRQSRLREATLLVHPWPLRLGSQAVVRFEKALRGKAPIDGVTARLVCREETKHSAGKYETVRKADRYAIDLDTSGTNLAPGRVKAEWSLTIPRHELPSLSVKSNRVQWLLETRTSTGGSDVAADFELLVHPEVVQ